MQLCHTSPATSAVFDDPNLVSSAGLVPVLTLARSAGLQELASQHLTVPSDKGANAGLKVTSLVAGADSIDDMALLRHGGMGRVFANAYAPSTLGSFLRSFTFGHVRQLDAVASRFLTRLAAQAPLIAPAPATGGRVVVDIDDTIIEVHGYAKQGSGFGYSGVRGLTDADAAGLAEVRYGAAAGCRGLVIVTTLGTGIGSAIVYDGVLVPNSELGHLDRRPQRRGPRGPLGQGE